jgi:hypothetical protein
LGQGQFEPRDPGLASSSDQVKILKEVVDAEMAKPISERQEWIFFTDSDTIVLNREIPIEDILPPHDKAPHVQMVIGRDGWGVNAGVFFLRISSVATAIFDRLIQDQALGSAICPRLARVRPGKHGEATLMPRVDRAARCLAGASYELIPPPHSSFCRNLPLREQTMLQLMLPLDEIVIIEKYWCVLLGAEQATHQKRRFNAWGKPDPHQANRGWGEAGPATFQAHFNGDAKQYLKDYKKFLSAPGFSDSWADGVKEAKEALQGIWADYYMKRHA